MIPSDDIVGEVNKTTIRRRMLVGVSGLVLLCAGAAALVITFGTNEKSNLRAPDLSAAGAVDNLPDADAEHASEVIGDAEHPNQVIGSLSQIKPSDSFDIVEDGQTLVPLFSELKPNQESVFFNGKIDANGTTLGQYIYRQ
jgi:hypothetical protein